MTKKIKWIEGRTSKPYQPYDYPEGFPYWDDRGYSVLWDEYFWGENRERRKQFPKELRRRKILPAKVTFQAVDENGKNIFRWIEVELEKDCIPVRTVLYILNNDKNLRNIRRASNGW